MKLYKIDINILLRTHVFLSVSEVGKYRHVSKWGLFPLHLTISGDYSLFPRRVLDKGSPPCFVPYLLMGQKSGGKMRLKNTLHYV